MYSRIDEVEYRKIADKYNLDVQIVRTIVRSFFDIISIESDSLPFDNARKIYLKDKFNSLVSVRNIPYIGRIGPVYSRYIKWRANEAKGHTLVSGSRYRSHYSQDDIEHIAAEILSGKAPSEIRKVKGNELYNRVWLVGQDRKKSARQLLNKENK